MVFKYAGIDFDAEKSGTGDADLFVESRLYDADPAGRRTGEAEWIGKKDTGIKRSYL